MPSECPCQSAAELRQLLQARRIEWALHRSIAVHRRTQGELEDIGPHSEPCISHQPLYAVTSVGVTEEYSRRSTEAFVAEITALTARCQLEGIVPIFIGVPPVADGEGAGSLLETTYRLRDAERAAFLDVQPTD
jgi:hypothetical protein